MKLSMCALVWGQEGVFINMKGVFINVVGLLTWHSVVFFAGEEQEKGGSPVLA